VIVTHGLPIGIYRRMQKSQSAAKC
jgi:hypothetical protein